jgi:AcrR family transcriptional regulator
VDREGGIVIKERIIAAFTELSRQKGFYRITVDEIAAGAGVSKRTVYRYFNSKDEIIEAVIDKLLSTVGGRLEKIIASDKEPDKKFEDILNIFYHVGRTFINPMVMQDLNRHYPQYWEKIDKYRMERAHLLIGIFLKEGQNRLAGSIDPRIAAAAVLASVQAVLNPEFILANQLTFEEAARQLVEFFKHGFIRDTGGASPAANA